MDKLQIMLKERNITIEMHDIAHDKEKRIADDKDLAKKQAVVVQALKQEASKVNIDISIADSRIKDLQNLKEMTLGQIKEIFTDKKRIDKEIADILARIEGRGMTE